MSSSRRLSNGRSPLLRKQCQITSFFSPGKSSEPNPSPNPSPSSCSNPSPVGGTEKQNKRLLVITPPPASSPATPSTIGNKGSHSSEVAGKRIRVFWPLDNAWYEGHVESFDESSGKHVIQYDDAEEELLDLQKEKFEWIEGELPRNLRRLRRLSGIGSMTPSPPFVSNKVEAEEEICTEASTEDEDWVQVCEKEAAEDDSEDMELENVEDVPEEAVSRSRKSVTSSSSKSSSRLGKRRKIVTEKMDCAKVVNFDDIKVNTEHKAPHADNKSNQLFDGVHSNVTIGAIDRFEKRHMEKFKFLGAARKDACGRHPGDADYNPTTLYLPQDFLKSLSGGQRQWWEFKSKHMDKVLFFKMGKFYELFEMDAHIGARELDLQYMNGDQPHCGFPEKNYPMNLEKLARKGYRVLVVEQTETPEQLEQRRKEMGTKDKVVKREVCAVVSMGTLIEGESLLINADAAYLMSITEKRHNSDKNHSQGTVLGVCVVDVSTSKFILGQFDDNLDRDCLCSILSELRPVEIIKPCKVLSPETENVLMHNTRNPLVNQLAPSSEFWNAEKTISEIKKIYSSLNHSGKSGMKDDTSDVCNNEKYSGALPDILTELDSAGENGCFALSALGGSLYYLRQSFLDEALLKCASFEALPCVGSLNKLQKPYLILDAPALDNLEILENRNGNPSGTLYAQLDRCVTPFGKRLLKSWLARPLHEIDSIVARQDAISAFKVVGLASALEFRKLMSGIPDMERLLARQFTSCEAFGRNSSAVILYEDASRKKLLEFLRVLRGCQLMVQGCSSLSSILAITESSLIHHLLTPGKGLPNVSKLLKYFKDAFNWSEAEQSGRIIPQQGCDSELDAVCKVICEVESGLMKHLKDQHKLLGNSSINYATVGKDTYLLEVPESLRSVIPRDYELHSSKKGYFRYWTAEIKKYKSELSRAEAEKESKLQGILIKLMMTFIGHHSKWRQLVSITAELDVLISLALASSYYEGPTCRPIIKDITCSNTNTTPFLSAKCLGHPTLCVDTLGRGSFVPNDVNIGGSEHANFILLTGPNMGGKSTLLRQVCMAIILAQIGADVPAESFEISPVDRIFVRMGARDHIFSGQSTFLMELSETASVLTYATQNSFVALDELGRGTSTFDGQAIARSVLQYLVHVIGCRGMFSTHYHRLAADFCRDSKVSVCHMACHVEKGSDGVEEVAFLYRLTLGACPKSYGVNVARLAGLPPSVLQKAMARSRDFEAFRGTSKDEERDIIQALLRLAKSWKLEADPQAVDIRRVLRDIQQRAQLLAEC